MRDKSHPAGVGGPDLVISELARRQHGVVAARQLVAIGLSRDAILRRARAGRLHPLHKGVYAVGHTRLTQQGRWMSAVLCFPVGAVLSHRSAAALWRIAAMHAGRIDVTVPGRGGSGRRGVRPGIAVHRPRELTDRDGTTRWKIPVTTPPRTLFDLAEILPPTQLRRAFEESERLGLVDRLELARRCGGASGRRGTGVLRSLVTARPVPFSETRSELERRFLRFCRDRSLPIPSVNVPLGDFVVDCLWRDARVVVELDSWAYHGDRESFEADRRRDVAIQRLGYRMVRVTKRRIEGDPDVLEAELRALLGIGFR